MKALKFFLPVSAAALLAACGKPPEMPSEIPSVPWPGKPTPEKAWKGPHEISDFKVLYSQNCAGCHNLDSSMSAAIPMGNPVYLALVPEARLREVITKGIPGTQMSPMALSEGGMLTDEQVDILVENLMAQRPSVDVPLPPYSAPLGNAANGEKVYQAILEASKDNEKAMIWLKGLTDQHFLSLVSDQYIRTLVIAGRPDLGVPDWRTIRGATALSNAEIADLVAWLVSHRSEHFSEQPAAAATTPSQS